MRRTHGLLRAAALVAGGLCAAAAIPAQAGTGAAQSTRLNAAAQTVSGHRLAKLPSAVRPLTSSTDTSDVGAHWSVFSRTSRTPDLWIYGGNHGTDPVADLVAVAADSTHTTHTFGVATADMQAFSSAGRVVTAGSVQHPRRVYWWTHPFKAKPGHAHNTLAPDGYRYLTSAPTGWVEVDAAGQLFVVDAESRQATPLGPAFPDASLSAVSGPTGVVVTYGDQIAFVSFSTGRVTALDSSLSPDKADCSSVSRRAAACENLVDDADGDLEPSKIFLAPLDGTAAFDVVQIPDLNDDNPFVVPATFKNAIAWLSTSDADQLNVKTPHGKHTTSYRVGSNPVAGPSGVLVSTFHDTKVLVVDRQLQSRRLVANRPSRAEALSFSLSKKRIAWAEDDGVPSASALRLHRRSITRDGGVPRLGKTSTVADNAQRSPIAVSAKYAVYAKGAPKSHGFSHQLRVVSSDSTQTIRHVLTKAPLTLSGHRLLYAKAEHEVAVANLKSGKSTSYTCLAAALDGDHLVLARQVPGADPGTANIWLIDLGSGKKRHVADAVTNPSVFVHGSFVGWLDWGFPPGGGHFQPRSEYRDMSTNGAVVELPADELLWSLTDAGVLSLKPLDDALRYGMQQFDSRSTYVPMPRARFLLRSYGSTDARTVLTGYGLKIGPQISGGVIAWVDARGHLKARRLS